MIRIIKRRILSVFIAVVMLLPAFPVNALAVQSDYSDIIENYINDNVDFNFNVQNTNATNEGLSLSGLNQSSFPVPNDILEVEGGVLKDGVLVFDLGTYGDAYTEATSRFPITIKRPKGEDAGYPVRASLRMFRGSNNCFAFPTEKDGDDYYQLTTVEIPAFESSTTIYIDYSDGLNDSYYNDLKRGSITNYLLFTDFDRTDMNNRILQFNLTKQTGSPVTGTHVVNGAYVENDSGPVTPGSQMIITADLKFTSPGSSDEPAYCEITSGLTLTLKKGSETKQLKPAEAVGSIADRLSFIMPVGEDKLNIGWEIVSITGIKSAVDGSVVDLTFDSQNMEDGEIICYDLREGQAQNQVDIRPEYGPITTDKALYKGLEEVNVTIPLLNADLLDEISSGRYAPDDVSRWFALSVDGGQSFIPAKAIQWDAVDESIKASFLAPINPGPDSMKICVEVFEDSGLVQKAAIAANGFSLSARGIYGAYKFIDVSTETAEFVPVESITVTGLPSNNIIKGNYWETDYPLTVVVQPANATFKTYTFAVTNSSVARVSSLDQLSFNNEGRTTVSLISDEVDYRQSMGLPSNDAVLKKSSTFYVGEFEARLITSSVSANINDDKESVTALFNDNFDIQDGEWDVAALTYEIKDANGVVKATGTTTKTGTDIPVKLTFGGAMPKTVSNYQNGTFVPAYYITLTAHNGSATISATSSVYVMPPEVTVNCTSDVYGAGIGEEVALEFAVGNLAPGYTTEYSVSLYGSNTTIASGTLESAGFVKKTADNGISSLTGQIKFTIPQQTETMRLYEVNVSAVNPGELNQAGYTRSIRVLNSSETLVNKAYSDGLGNNLSFTGHVLSGIRESRLAELAGTSDYNSKAAFEYVDAMMRPQSLSVNAPYEWGGMSITTDNGTRPAAVYGRLYGNEEGKLVTLSWGNVPTRIQFVYEQDDLSGKAFVYKLNGASDSTPVHFIYLNGLGQMVEKNVTPYLQYVVIYEPSGMSDVRIVQETAGSDTFRAYSAAPKSLINGSSFLYVSDTAIKSSDSKLNENAMQMTSNPTAKFKASGTSDSYTVRYGVLDKDNKYIAATGGSRTVLNLQQPNTCFEYSFGDLYKNPDSKLMLEVEYIDPDRVMMYKVFYFDLQQLERMWENSAITTLPLAGSRLTGALIQTVTLQEPTGQTDLTGVSPYSFTTFKGEGTKLEIMMRYTNHYRDRTDRIAINILNSTINEGFLVTPEKAMVMDTVDYPFLENSYVTLSYKIGDKIAPNLPANVRLLDRDTPTESIALLPGLYCEDPEALRKAEEIANLAKVEVDVADGQKQMNLDGIEDKVQSSELTDVLGDFGLEIPIPGQPFSFEVKKVRNEYIIKGCMSYSFIPGGAVLDNLGKAGDFNTIFQSCLGAVKPNMVEGGVLSKIQLPSAFAGVRGYMIGKAVVNPQTGDVEVSFVEGGIVGEISGSVSGHISFVFGNFGFRIKGLLSLGLYVSAPTGDTSKNDASWVQVDFGTETRLMVDVLVYVGVGLDIFFFSETVGIEGAAGVDFRGKAVYRPYMNDPDERVQAGLKTDLHASLRGYQRGYFLFWSWADYWDIFVGNWSYLTPEDPSNPYYKSSGRSRMSLLAETYKGLISPASDALMTGIDTAVSAKYYDKGSKVIYKDTGIVDDFMDDTLKTFDVAEPNYSWNIEGWDSTSAFGFDSASASDGKTFAARETMNERFDPRAVLSLDDEGLLRHAASMSEIRAGIYDGENWEFTKIADNDMMDIAPKTATNGKNGIVVWTQGFLNGINFNGSTPSPDIGERKLVFAQYDGDQWRDPLPLFVATSDSIVDYAVAMDKDGNSLVAAVTASGEQYIIKVGEDGAVTAIDNELPAASKTSLIYNGETYALACYDMDNNALALSQLDTDGYMIETVFTNVPADIGSNFKMFKDTKASGMGSVVLAWHETKEDETGNQVTKIYASRFTKHDNSDGIVLSAPIVAATELNGASVASLDAYICGSKARFLAAYGNSDGSAYLSESNVTFTNAIEVTPGENDIYSLRPGFANNLNFIVKNNGFAPITGITARVSGGQPTSVETVVPPNGETTISCAFVPDRSLPDDIEYTITSTFADGIETTVMGTIECRQADITVSDVTLEPGDDSFTLSAIVSNSGPFSPDEKTVTVGLYKDPLGLEPICETQAFDGSEFETLYNNIEMGSGLEAEFMFTNPDNLPLLYIIAKTSDQSGIVPDRHFEDNLQSVSMPLTETPVMPNISIDDRVVITLQSWPEEDSDAFNPIFNLTAKEGIDVTLYVAGYDSDGRLMQVGSKTISLASGEGAEIQASIARTNGYTYKFFIWDSAFKPLTGITSY